MPDCGDGSSVTPGTAAIVVVISALSRTAGSDEVAVTWVLIWRSTTWPGGMVSSTRIGWLAPGFRVVLGGIRRRPQPRDVLAARLILSTKLPLFVSPRV